MSHVVKGINDIQSQRPDVLKDWDYDLNTELKPDQVSIGSTKKVWWKCVKGHSYLLSPGQKVHGQGCPLCAGKYCVSGINDFATMCPEMMAEWDYDSNGSLDPHSIYYKSTKFRVHWQCEKGHKWDTILASRVERNTGCPVCAGNVVLAGFNDLQSGFPLVAATWNFEKNASLLPTQVTRFSTKKVWWKCPECGYEWMAQIANRTGNESGCPKCSNYSHTSFPEQALYYYVYRYFPDTMNGYRYNPKNKRSELDIFIPSLNTGIEYDGVAWHRNSDSLVRDEKKYIACQKLGIRLIRVAEYELSSKEQLCDIYVYRDINSPSSLQNAIVHVLLALDVEIPMIDLDTERDMILSQYLNVQKEKSLALRYPEIAREWLYEKNGEITPAMVNSSTDRKYWWKCKNGHEWRMSVVNRTFSHCNCPYCSGKRVLSGYNDLQTRYPDIAQWWDNEKNAPLRACDVMPGSVKKYWWVCEKGHSYQASPNVKTANKTGCPICSNALIVSGINSIADTHPQHFRYWDTRKNNETDPMHISSGTEKNCFWICPLGHSWEEKVSSFTHRKPVCPYCSGLRLLKGYNDLQSAHPELMEDWDYDENDIDPSEIRSNSTIKVSWKCKKCGRKWKTQVRARAIDKKGCPVCCYEQKAPVNRIKALLSNGRSLAARFPEIANEWDYENNEGKTPEQVTYGSSFMASWICPKGHRYKAIISSRTGKQKCGCSFCRYERASMTLKKKRTEFSSVNEEAKE